METFFRLDALSGSFQLMPVLTFPQTNVGGAVYSAGYFIRGDGTANEGVVLVTGGTRRVAGTASRPGAGDYVHSVLTYDGANVVGYRDGVQTVTVAGTGTIDDSQFGGDDEISANGTSAASHDCTILLSRIYNRPLSASEIAYRYRVCLGRVSGASDIWILPFLPQDEPTPTARMPRYGFTSFQIPAIV
jgi:hypothetical protein